MSAVRLHILVRGIVQGVGFRPAVYRLAISKSLSGWVKNVPQGVAIEIQGPGVKTESFADALCVHAPPQAKIQSVESQAIPAQEEDGFRILASGHSGDLVAGMPPDLATCPDCRKELFDASNRRFGYPFLNCTNCGPRFTIMTELPYDRERTSMRAFTMCPPCDEEYRNPMDRRFDAQPNACGDCGPQLEIRNMQGDPFPVKNPVAVAAEMLDSGKVVAVKGLGGYHLACEARSDTAVQLLRKRKHRPAKALAVMFANIEEVKARCSVDPLSGEALQSPSAPVVILPLLDAHDLSRLLSPDTCDIGAFLAYTPLHHLLLEKTGPLVMTSANHSEEPIISTEKELFALLHSVADAALSHDRAIVRACDDSVMRFSSGQRTFLRRSRGYVPESFPLGHSGPSVLACGGDLKNTFCITREERVFLSQHIGDLADMRSRDFYQHNMDDLKRLLGVRPETVAHDMHPDYVSTRLAQGLGADKHIAIQHHHAHVASCICENRVTGQVIGVAFDGTGYGPDKTAWGGEFLIADARSYSRVAHLDSIPLPGGEEAIRHPLRTAFSYVMSANGKDKGNIPDIIHEKLGEETMETLAGMIAGGVHTPLTTSAGRLFDAVSSLLGLCDRIDYAGQAAVRLECIADTGTEKAFPYNIVPGEKADTLSFLPAIREICKDLKNGVVASELSGKFHRTLVEGIVSMCVRIREKHSLSRVALSGGVFQNMLLLNRLRSGLQARGFDVYCHHLVPPNDGGLSLGQAAIASALETRNA